MLEFQTFFNIKIINNVDLRKRKGTINIIIAVKVILLLHSLK